MDGNSSDTKFFRVEDDEKEDDGWTEPPDVESEQSIEDDL